MIDYLTTTAPFSWIMGTLGFFFMYGIFFIAGLTIVSIIAQMMGFDDKKLVETPRVNWVVGIIMAILYCIWLTTI